MSNNSITSVIEEFRAAAMREGIEFGEIIPDGALHRASSPNDRPGNKPLWYILFADGVPAGSFGCWRRGINRKWCAKPEIEMTKVEKIAHATRMEDVKKARLADIERIHANCQKTFAAVYAKAEFACDKHPYLACKAVKPHNAKIHEGKLLLPLKDFNGVIHGVQLISGDGTKRYVSGTNKTGHFFSIGSIGKDKLLVLCEGFATGATINEATSYPVLVCFDAGNLLAVAKRVRAAFPELKIVLAADDDHATEGNPGVTKATEAAKAVNGYVAVPVFPIPREPQHTDFNDLFKVSGKETVGSQILAVVRNSSTPPRPSLSSIVTMEALLGKTFEPIRWVIPELLPEGLAILSGPPKIGKSWLVMNLCIATAIGGYALGKFKVDKGEVLLASLEDNERRLQGRSLKCCPAGSDLSLLHTTTTWPRLDDGGLEQLTTWLSEHPECKLVIFDTIQKVKPHASRKNGTAYENDYDAYGPLQRIALKFHACVLVIHHNRKTSSRNDEDPLEEISGSIGITGAMDTILMLKRPRGASGAVLISTGRDIAESQYALNFDGATGQWIVDGRIEEVGLQDNKNPAVILNHLKSNAGKQFTVQEIHQELQQKIRFDTLKRELNRLVTKNIIRRHHGSYGYYEPIVSLSQTFQREAHQGQTGQEDTPLGVEALPSGNKLSAVPLSQMSQLQAHQGQMGQQDTPVFVEEQHVLFPLLSENRYQPF